MRYLNVNYPSCSIGLITPAVNGHMGVSTHF